MINSLNKQVRGIFVSASVQGQIVIPAIQMVISMNLKHFEGICLTILPPKVLLGIADLLRVSWSFKYLSISISIFHEFAEMYQNLWMFQN